MEKINNSRWFFSKDFVGGKVSGNIKEFETLFVPSIDDIQIMLTSETVKDFFPKIKEAFENNKPFRFNLRNKSKSSWKKTKTIFNGKEITQLQIRGIGEYIDNYDSNKINNATENYSELYYNWEELPEKLKNFIKDPN